MEKLTNDQILSTLALSENFPSVVWYTQVDNFNGCESVVVQVKHDATLEEAEECVKTIFPDTTFKKYVTSDYAFSMVFEGHEIGSLHLKVNEEETPAPTEVPEEIINREEIFQPNYTTESEVVANA